MYLTAPPPHTVRLAFLLLAHWLFMTAWQHMHASRTTSPHPKVVGLGSAPGPAHFGFVFKHVVWPPMDHSTQTQALHVRME